MYRFSLLTALFAVVLATAPIASFSSAPETEMVAPNDAEDYLKTYMKGFKNGNFVIGTTTPDGVKSIIGKYFTETDGKIAVGKTFAGFSFDAEWYFEDGVLNEFKCFTFYDEDQRGKAAKDCDATFELMKSIFGEPITISTGFYDWNVGDMKVSCDLFEDGYSIYVDPPSSGDGSLDISCVGDFYNLKKDLKEIFVANMKSGAIKIGSTTKSQMQTITGNGESFYKEYDGLWATATYTYDDNSKLTSLIIDYFYDCEGALVLLDMDKEDVTKVINEAIGSEGFKDSDSIDATVRWNVGGQSLRQMGFEDGYSIYFDK